MIRRPVAAAKAASSVFKAGCGTCWIRRRRRKSGAGKLSGAGFPGCRWVAMVFKANAAVSWSVPTTTSMPTRKWLATQFDYGSAAHGLAGH